MTLNHLTRALQEEALKLLRQSHGGYPPKASGIIGHSESVETLPFAESFWLEAFDASVGSTRYIVTITQVNKI